MGISFRTLKFPWLNISFSRVQTFIGLAAGVLSITGALAAFFKPAPDKSELVAIVQDAKTEKAVSDATIEILTLQNAVVTTLTPDWYGKARCALDEGHYRAEVREVQLVSRQSTEVRVQLRTGTSVGGAMRRLFHR